MGRTQWIWFTCSMVLLFLGMPFLSFDSTRTAGGIWMAVWFVILMASTIGSLSYIGIRNMRIRSRGVPTQARILHCTASGTVNDVPNYELEVELPDGAHARLMVRTWDTLYPNQPITVLVDPRFPGHATASIRNTDF